MTRRIAIRKAAELDFQSIESWYERRRLGLSTEFRLEIDLLLQRIAERPFSFPAMHRDARRALVARFPYKIWFRVFEDEIVIIACTHAARGPRFTRARIK